MPGDKLGDQTRADFRFPTEKQFELMAPPEAKPGYSANVSETENGEPLNRTITDEKGRTIYYEEYWYVKDKVPSPDSLGGHRQEFSDYDPKGRVSTEVGQNFPDDPKHKDHQWKIEHSYGEEDGSHTMSGVIETGPEAGHRWKTIEQIRDLDATRRIIVETTEILEQGKSQDKPVAGSVFRKTKFFENDEYLGEKAELPDGQVKPTLAPGVEELPNWQY